MNSTIETIDDLIAATKASVKWYGGAVVALAAAAVALLIVLFVARLYTQALTLTGPGLILGFAVTPWTQMASRRERITVLQAERRRAVRAGSNEAELRRIEDVITALASKV